MRTMHASPITQVGGANCCGCPVNKRTRLRGCAGTPWEMAETGSTFVLPSGDVMLDAPIHRVLYHLRFGRWSTASDADRHAVCDHIRDRCKQEADFLKSLRGS